MIQQSSRTAAAAVFRDSIHTEDHLPCTVFVVQRSILIHLVPEVGVIRDHAVDKADHPVAIQLDPEMVGVNSQPLCNADFGGGFRSREAFCFNLYNFL